MKRGNSSCALVLLGFAAFTCGGAAAQSFFGRMSGAPSSITCTNTSFTVGPGLTYSWNLPAEELRATVVSTFGVGGQNFSTTTSVTAAGPAGTIPLQIVPPPYGPIAFPYTFTQTFTPVATGGTSSSYSFRCAGPTASDFTIANGAPFGPARDYSDVYYIPAESGWGMFVVHSDTFLFVAFFIHDGDGKPIWHTAELSFDGQSSYTGPLYSTTGTPFGDPWDPSKSQSTQVGTASFTPTDPYRATLVYSLDGKPPVTKNVQRQTLLPYQMAGNYAGSLVGKQTGCSDPADNGEMTVRFNLAVTQNGDNSIALAFTLVDPDNEGVVCTVTGPLTHLGRLYRVVDGQLSCREPNGAPEPPTTVLVESLRLTGQGIEGQFSGQDPGSCKLSLRFAAAKR
jgi:hypothetical protein